MNTPRIGKVIVLGLLAALVPALTPAWAQDPATQKKKKAALVYTKPQAPAVLPGKGLLQHDFLYAGQQAFREKGVHLVRGGKVVWTYHDPEERGEVSDATLLPNGNVLLAHAYGVRIVRPDKTIAWRHDVKPAEHEIHGAQAIGQDRVIFLQTGAPTGRIIVANIVTGKFEKQIEVPLGATSNLGPQEPRYVHMQMRRLRLTPAGTVIIAYLDANKVCEYDESGREIWSAKVDRPWSVERLKNGNTLVNLTAMEVVELNPRGEAIWKFTKADAEAQGFVMTKWQVATRLANGNTLINNEGRWQPGASPEGWAPVQALEVSPEKKVVWALRSWTGPNALGSATTIHVLDDPNMNPKGAHFGSIK
jgi:hypothetical protein